jgi:hypothetical protein
MLIQQENDGGVSSTMIFIRTFVNVTMYPQYSNNMTKKKKKVQSPLRIYRKETVSRTCLGCH